MKSVFGIKRSVGFYFSFLVEKVTIGNKHEQSTEAENSENVRKVLGKISRLKEIIGV